MNEEILAEALTQTMPFGRYKGQKLINLPEPYLVWFHRQGFPNTRLGRQLALMYEIKLNGLEAMLSGRGSQNAGKY
ncbi:MAG: DUF3820 family protein [Pseudohongiella sp.]|uniref:DUF3820 family protein n=1 Tax=Pseudohongiella sp. TaxID=1979412 RepID=UPI0034A00CED